MKSLQLHLKDQFYKYETYLLWKNSKKNLFICTDLPCDPVFAVHIYDSGETFCQWLFSLRLLEWG